MSNYDELAEQGVLGACLSSPDIVTVVASRLNGDDFYRPTHQRIYEAVLSLYDRGEPTDPVAVGDELMRNGQLVPVGGAKYLMDLMATPTVAANAVYHAEIVAEHGQRRRLATLGMRISQLADESTQSVDDLLSTAQVGVDGI